MRRRNLLRRICILFFFNDTATTEIYTLSLHDALPICRPRVRAPTRGARRYRGGALRLRAGRGRIRARRRSLREPRRRPGVPGRRAVLPRLLARAGRRGARDARVWVIRTVASVSVVDDVEAGC